MLLAVAAALLGTCGNGASPPPPPFGGADALVHGGLCPASELECPDCAPKTPVRCPQGDCRASVRDCTPNVYIRGECGPATCGSVEFCHLHPGAPYACWQSTPSEHNASMTFSRVEPNRCGHCTSLLSHYPCANCCGERADAAWSGSYASPIPAHDGGAIFMEGTRWICMLTEVAARQELANSAAGLSGAPPQDAGPPPSPPPEPDWPELLRQDQDIAARLMPDDWDLQ